LPVLTDQSLAHRIALIVAVPVASVGLIAVAQFAAPSPSTSALTALTGADSTAGGGESRAGSSGARPGSGPGASATSATSATTASGSAAGRKAVTGRYQLRGPASAPAGASVTFELQGPARLVRVDSSAPFTVQIDTRTLPDGSYRLTVTTMIGTRRIVTSTSMLTVANHGAPSTTATGAPSSTGTRPTGSSDPGPTGSGATRPGTATTTTATTSSSSRTTSQPAPTTSQPTAGSFTDQVVSLTNAQRLANGCKALTVNGTLTAVAQAHSQDMATRDYFDHVDPEGRSPFDRMTAAGYQFSSAAENIAAGQPTPAAVLDAWMNSAGHRANILNCSLTQIGVGYATGGRYGTYWTQDFGTPR
jgi:uncharacterized protein YkwD